MLNSRLREPGLFDMNKYKDAVTEGNGDIFHHHNLLDNFLKKRKRANVRKQLSAFHKFIGECEDMFDRTKDTVNTLTSLSARPVVDVQNVERFAFGCYGFKFLCIERSNNSIVIIVIILI